MTIEELKRELASAAADAAAASLTEEEEDELKLREAIKEKRAEAAAIAQKRRELNAAERLDAARLANPGRILTSIDLVAMFPADAMPEKKFFPTGGVVIVGDAAHLEGEITRAVEHKNAPDAKGLEVLMSSVFARCLVDPGPDNPGEQVRMGQLISRFPAAASACGAICRRLGGAKSQERPRGRE